MFALCTDLSDRLTNWRVQDLDAALWTLGVRTWACFINLTDDEFFEVCQLVRQAGAGPGHVCTLRLIRSETSATMPANLKGASNPLGAIIEELRALVGEAVRMISESSKDGTADALLVEAQALLVQIRSFPEGASDNIAARALDLVNTAAKTGAKHRQLKRIVQDVLVLCCCRKVDHSDVNALRRSFTTAFGRDVQSEGLVSKLLNSRWQLFGLSYKKRPPKKKKQSTSAGEGEDNHESCTLGARTCQHDEQEPHMACPKDVAPDFGSDELSKGTATLRADPEFCWWQHFPIKVNNTFLELDDSLSNKSRGRSCAAASSPGGWPFMSTQYSDSSSQCTNNVLIKLRSKDTLSQIGSSKEAVTTFLTESFESLRKALSWTFSDSESSHSGGDAADMSRDRALLVDIALQSQMVSQQLTDSCMHENVLLGAEEWLQSSLQVNFQKRHRMTQQFIFLGLLLGIKNILPMLFHALEAGFQSSAFDEDLIYSACRALIELKALGLLTPVEAASVLNHVTDRAFKPATQYCISAYMGLLGSLSDPFVNPMLWERMFSDIVYYGNYYLPKHNTDELVYEAVWALNQLFKHAGSHVLGEWADKCLEFADKVKKDPYLSSCRDGWAERCPDAISALNEAEKLELYLRPLRCSSPNPPEVTTPS